MLTSASCLRDQVSLLLASRPSPGILALFSAPAQVTSWLSAEAPVEEVEASLILIDGGA